MPYYENFEEFKTRMGCPCEKEADGSDVAFVFENGASSRYGFHTDPSHDLATLLQGQMRYQRLALKRKEGEFEGLKNRTVENLFWVRRSPLSVAPFNYEGVMRTLERLRGEILLHRQRIDEIAEQYKSETEEGRQQAVVENLRREEQRQRDELLAETQRQVSAINTIRI